MQRSEKESAKSSNRCGGLSAHRCGRYQGEGCEWVCTSSDKKSLITAYTDGVNGVVVDDYRAAVETLEFFVDDAMLFGTALIVLQTRKELNNNK